MLSLKIRAYLLNLGDPKRNPKNNTYIWALEIGPRKVIEPT